MVEDQPLHWTIAEATKLELESLGYRCGHDFYTTAQLFVYFEAYHFIMQFTENMVRINKIQSHVRLPKTITINYHNQDFIQQILETIST